MVAIIIAVDVLSTFNHQAEKMVLYSTLTKDATLGSLHLNHARVIAGKVGCYFNWTTRLENVYTDVQGNPWSETRRGHNDI